MPNVRKEATLACAMLLLTCGGLAWPAATGTKKASDANASAAQSPEQKAIALFNSGVRAVSKADKQATAAANAAAAGRNTHALKAEQKALIEARGAFEQAVELDPRMPEAWNYLGYMRRRLGDYEGALQAYDQALKLKPSFAEAIEYRAEAYLRMKRLEDVRQAYVDLFEGNRQLADQLLASMQTWLAAQPAAGDASLEDFARWVHECSENAARTAGPVAKRGTAPKW